MGLLKSTLESQICEYDFAQQGGAIGTYKLGLQLPQGCMLINLTSIVKTTFTSGGLATVSLGLITLSANPVSSSPTSLLGATAIAGMIAFAKFGGSVAPLPQYYGVYFEITLSIAVADLTAGNLIVFANYYATDLHF